MQTEFCRTEYSIGMLLERLHARSCFPTQHGHDWVAYCPCHPVAQSYLIVWATQSGEPSLECKGGCSADEILAALGMVPCDLLTAATCSRSTSSHDATGIGNGDEANWWKDRGKLPNDEPVIVTVRDSQGCLRTQIVPWGNIEDDFATTPLGLLQIVNVERVSDLPIPDEELAPRFPPAIRDSPDLELPGESFASQPSRWERKLRKCQNYYWKERGAAKFAEVLGVSTIAVLSLGAVADEDNRRWFLPERDSAHYITGLAVRYMKPWRDENGVFITKGFVSGGRRGLYYADDWWQSEESPIVMPEGFSDAAACLSMGFSTIGRPSAAGGNPALINMLLNFEVERELILIADRDWNEKTGQSAGLKGALRAAEALAAHLQKEVLVALPPAGFKDTRDWLNAFCAGDRSEEKFALARQAFLKHLLETADVIQPGCNYELPVDICATISLDDWRCQMREARVASLSAPGHYADCSPTGAGKSHADQELIQAAIATNKKFLLVVPTHANCTEEVDQLAAAGIPAVAYPELTKQNCQKYRDASSARANGLDLARSVCADCPLMRDDSCTYRQRLKTAKNAQVAVCTTKRLGLDRSASIDRDVISVHEAADSVICDQYVLGRREIANAGQVLRRLGEAVLIDDTQSAIVQQRNRETQTYINGLASICDELAASLRRGQRGWRDLKLYLPPGYWTKFTAEYLEEANVSDAVREAAREQGIEWPAGKIEGATMRGLVMIAQGESWDVMNQPVEKEGRSLRQAKIVVQRRLRFEANQTCWWQDATGDVALLQRLLGAFVRDMTPHGQLERLQAVEVVPVDISRKTVIQTVANAIRMTVMTSGCQRLGIIGHKNHVDLLRSEEDQLLIPEIRARIHRFSYFGAGLDRGSNQWLQCDRLLVLGTPRVGDDAIREELWRDGDRNAAQIRDPGWTKYTWQARAAGYQDKVVTVVGRCYSDPAWHQACLRVTRAAMRQTGQGFW